jgi:acyl-CoA thioesterase FadM
MARWCRLLLIFLSQYFQSKIHLSDEAVRTFRVWATEADKKYMNNASFWTITEMGQLDFFFRTGFYKFCRRKHWFPLVGSQKMVYKKPLRRFEKFQLVSKMFYCDDKWMFFEQTFVKNGQLIANALVKVIFKGPDGTVPVKRIMSVLKQDLNLSPKTFIDNSEQIDKILIESYA